MNPHSYRGNGNYPENTMIDYVYKESYSKLARDFPILKAKKELEEDERWWLRSYVGRQWWRRCLLNSARRTFTARRACYRRCIVRHY